MFLCKSNLAKKVFNTLFFCKIKLDNERKAASIQNIANLELLISSCMNSLLIRRCLFYNAFLLLIIFSGCTSHSKKEHSIDNYVVSAGDTISNVDTIVSKVDAMVTANKLETAIAYITVNMHRFIGKEKAVLYDQRGNAYFLKDDLDNAVANYLSAAELDSENASYLINVAKTYENLENTNNAAFFAKKVIALQTVSDTDMTVAKEVLFRCDRMHVGH